jgi:hypothetical protein
MIENTWKVSIRQGDGIDHMSFSNGNSRAKCCCLGGSGHVIHLISALFPRVLPLPIRRCRGCWLGGTDSCSSGVQTLEAAENCTFSSLARLGSHRLICTNLSLEAMSSLHIFFDSSLLLLYFFFASSSYICSITTSSIPSTHVLVEIFAAHTPDAMSASRQPSGKAAKRSASSNSQQPQSGRLTALERNNLEWESHKNEIRSRYMDQDETLEETIQWFKQERSIDWR